MASRLADLSGILGPTDDHARQAGPDGGPQIGQHHLRVNLRPHLRAAALNLPQRVAKPFPRPRLVPFGHKLNQVKYDDIRPAPRRGGQSLRLRRRRQQPGTGISCRKPA